VFENELRELPRRQEVDEGRTAPLYQTNPTFPKDPLGQGFFADIPPLDPNLTAAGVQIESVINLPNAASLTLLDPVGTFDAASSLEVRGGGTIVQQTTQGYPSYGTQGYNVPSLLGLAYSAPYLHDGSAATLEDVLARHTIQTPGGPKTIDTALTPTERGDLLEFLRGIDEDADDAVGHGSRV
jgi:hypothetical protein